MIDWSKIDINDKQVYEMLSRGECLGVFQLETHGMTGLIKRMKPQCFSDIVASIALYRPGPLEMNMDETYIRRKHGLEPVEYLIPGFEPILKETYGVILYQEQIMQIASEFAGFTLSEADSLRKAMGKKIASLMEEQRGKFVGGMVDNGYSETIAIELFGLIEKFSRYGFNKAHSVGYAMISFRTAYLKCYYPLHFMCSVLNQESDTDNLVKYIVECERMGIKVLPPNINESGQQFTIVGSHIRFGLSSIMNVGVSAAENIINRR
jgi:DNA polymerase-3 subunit alpha